MDGTATASDIRTTVKIAIITFPNNSRVNDGEISPSLAVISDGVMFYFTLINWVIVCKAVCIFGVASNSINMAVFMKTGFKDSINISLFALAISDFGSCFSIIFSTILLNPWLNELDKTVVWHEVQYLVACWPHVAFTKITTLITAFITFERCLCVALPLKVKTIITRSRVISYLIFSYLSVYLFMIPLFYSNQLGYAFDAVSNQTLFRLVFTNDRQAIEDVIFPIQYMIMSVFAFIFIMVSTVVLVVKLKEKSEWRLKAKTKSTKAEANVESTTKEQRISKMVVTISTLFIVCFFPTAIMQLIMWVDRRVSIDGVYSNLNIVMAYFTFTLESVNSAINIFIYYRNSSNYKAVFDQMFFSKRNETK